MKLIIAGSRTFPRDVAFRHLEAWRSWIVTATEVLSGQAAGPDTYGAEFATTLGIPVAYHPALWKAWGKRAGMVRNVEMARHATALLALWDGESPGTKHMIDCASQAGLTVVVLAPGTDILPCPFPPEP